MGQQLHTAHMLILPLIPVFILLAQNTATFLQYVSDADEILEVQGQVKYWNNDVISHEITVLNPIKVANAVDLSTLVQRLQEERAAVALNIFLNRTNQMDTISDLQDFALNGLDISRFTLIKVIYYVIS